MGIPESDISWAVNPVMSAPGVVVQTAAQRIQDLVWKASTRRANAAARFDYYATKVKSKTKWEKVSRSKKPCQSGPYEDHRSRPYSETDFA
jgi:hypothetical protein